VDLKRLDPVTVPCLECGIELAADSPELRLELTCDDEPIVYCKACWQRALEQNPQDPRRGRRRNLPASNERREQVMSSHRLRTLATIALAGGGLALAGYVGSGLARSANRDARASRPAASTSAAAPTWIKGYPNSIAVLGHSGATGENSDPRQPGVEVRENSWATGTNPKVDSVYLRILAHNPAIRGHNDNYAEAGADVQALSAQADRLLQRNPKPELILIQTIDADVTCPLDRRALSAYRGKLTIALEKLARGAPNSREFVVSQFGNPRTDAEILTREERASQGGTGPCDFVTPSGSVAPKKLVRLERAIHAYEAAVKTACTPVRQCTYGGDALSHTINKRAYYSNDLNHFSIVGHAEAAKAAWAAMQRTGIVPR
jgi:hypothetical protein